MPLTLRLVLGDQLDINHPWFHTVSPDVIFLLLEMRQETDYCHHHITKLAGFFLAMRRFGDRLQQDGHRVHYQFVRDAGSTQPLEHLLSDLISHYGAGRFEYMLPDEYRLDHQLAAFASDCAVPVGTTDTTHFLAGRDGVSDFFAERKTQVMEYFYRHMRRQHDILMEDDRPVGGKWNYDDSNRRKWRGEPDIPDALHFDHDASLVLKEISGAGIQTMGSCCTGRVDFPLDTREALDQLDWFCEHLLPWFGTYQDAMHTSQHDLFHSRLSFALNTKMISPALVVERVVAAWQSDPQRISLNQAEGFVRQVIGWREYIRGVYWQQMPGYCDTNYFDHGNQLPDMYWTGSTRMRCMQECLQNSLENAYAHHIQRLMVTGNFALLTGVHPDQVDAWYLGVYIDAVEWVQLPNTRGMSQYADGGLLATKPYVSSAAYIHRMSDYCSNCHYRRTELTGPRACPFNSLYWYFLIRHRDRLQANPRMGMMYRQLDRRSRTDQRELSAQALRIIDNPDAW